MLRSRASLLACILLPSALLVLYACGDSDGNSEFDDTRGDASTEGGDPPPDFCPDGGCIDDIDGGPDDRDAQVGVLTAIVRDFRAYRSADGGLVNPDFENLPDPRDMPDGGDAGGTPGGWTSLGEYAEATDKWSVDAGWNADWKFNIVTEDLADDNTPTYNTAPQWRGQPRTITTHGATAFQDWFHTRAPVNIERRVPLTLTRNANGVYSYDSATSGTALSATNPSKHFFPIDDSTDASTKAEGFGNQPSPPPENYDHNYHFTVELHTKFTYRGPAGNQVFKFSGDDDVFVYINKKLVINIGGIHSALQREINLPAIASGIGLVEGQEYQLDFFQAERHYTESNLRIDTTIDLRPSSVR